MTGTPKLRSLVASCGILLGASVAQAQDWPQWRGANRDAKATGFNSPETWPAELTKKWDVPVGDGVSTPSLVGDRLYVFTLEDGNEVLRCLNAETGEEIWQDKYEAEGADGPAGRFAGPRASPTVADGKVITFGVRGTLSCLDAQSGEIQWRKNDYPDSLPMFYTSSSPIVVDGLCIAQLGGERSGAIVAYDLATGDEKWKWTEAGTAYASPVAVELGDSKAIVAETSNSIVGLNVADGKELWSIDFPVEGRGYNASTPMLQGQKLIFSGSNRGTKAVELKKQGDSVTAEPLWFNEDASAQFNTPVLKDGMIYGLTTRDMLFCINADSGETEWTVPYSEAIGGAEAQQPAEQPQGRGRGRGGRGGGGYGSIVDAGSVLIALTPAADMVILKPSDEQMQSIASYKVSDSQTHAYPVASGNRLYIKDEDSIACWTVE